MAAVEFIPGSAGVPFPNAHSLRQQNMIWLGAASLLAVIVAVFALWHFKTPLKQSKEQVNAAKVETPVELPAEAKTQSSVREAKTQSSVREAKTPVAKDATVQSENSVTPLGALPETSKLRLVFGEESWTEIKDKDGNIISSQVNPAGSELRVEGNAPFSMLIGHAASASLYFRGKQVDLKPYINEYSEVAHLKKLK